MINFKAVIFELREDITSTFILTTDLCCFLDKAIEYSTYLFKQCIHRLQYIANGLKRAKAIPAKQSIKTLNRGFMYNGWRNEKKKEAIITLMNKLYDNV